MSRPRYRYLCKRCGSIYPAYAPAERCADSHGGGRIECLDPKPEADR